MPAGIGGTPIPTGLGDVRVLINTQYRIGDNTHPYRRPSSKGAFGPMVTIGIRVCAF